jgi:hypothetical protein
MGIKISQLPPIITPALSDVFPVVQSGVTYKETFSQLSSLFANSPVNTNITSMTGLTGDLKAPTGIIDANGNRVLLFTEVTNAVNYIDILNNSTGMGPLLIAEGTDTNITINLRGKGTGGVNAQTIGNIPFITFTGATFQHVTNFVMATTNATRTVTFPDATGTVNLATKANGTEAANAVTASGTAGVITTSALTLAGAANYAITWTNTFITTASTILLTIMGGTNTVLNITLTATASNGTSTLTIYNNTAATALNGTLFIGYMIIP